MTIFIIRKPLNIQCINMYTLKVNHISLYLNTSPSLFQTDQSKNIIVCHESAKYYCLSRECKINVIILELSPKMFTLPIYCKLDKGPFKSFGSNFRPLWSYLTCEISCESRTFFQYCDRYLSWPVLNTISTAEQRSSSYQVTFGVHPVLRVCFK